MKLTLPKQANEPLRIAVMKQSQNSVMIRNKVLKQSVVKAVENVINEYGKAEHNFVIGKPSVGGLYICKCQFSRFPIVLKYCSSSQKWLTERGEIYIDEIILGYIPIELTLKGIKLG